MKRLISILLFIFISIFFYTVKANIIGDVNGNNKVDTADYVLVRKYILNTVTLTDEQYRQADVNNDGKISSQDFIAIRKIIMGMLVVPTPEPTIIPTPTITPAPVPTATPIPTKTITAKFIVSNTNVSSESEIVRSCEAMENSECNITVPKLSVNDKYKFMGWSLTNNSKNVDYQENSTLSIKNDITLYAVVPEIITVTFNVSNNVDGKNVKAEKLAFSYTDTNGNTIISEENQENISTTCLSYNKEGCKIDKLPIVYAKGYIVHGYSKTIGGGNTYVLNTTFKANTTLYARVGYYNSTKVGNVNIGYQKLYGNVMLEIESGVSESVINSAVDTLNNLYAYYPEIFYYNGKVFLLRDTTYNQVLVGAYSNIRNTAGYTLAATNYNNSYVRVSGNTNDILGSMVHEIGHSFDNSFYDCISDRSELANLYNKYKNSRNRPFRNYTYTNTFEFYADTFSGVMTNLLKEKTGRSFYNKFNSIPSDVTDLIKRSLTEKNNDLRRIGLIK